MKDISANKQLQCVRSQCQNRIYSKVRFAKQLKLCQKHYNIYKNQYFHCSYCKCLTKRTHFSIGSYCSQKCKSLKHIKKHRWFKILNIETENIFPFLTRQYRYAFLLSDNFNQLIIDIKFKNDVNCDLKRLDKITNANSYKNKGNNNYFSILKISFYYYMNVAGLEYAFLPDCIIENRYKTQTENMNKYIECLPLDKQYQIFDYIFNPHLKNQSITDLPQDKIKIEDYLIYFSLDEPYNALPILKILEYWLSNLELNTNEKQLNKNTFNAFKKSTVNHIAPNLFIEIYALVVLYALVGINQYGIFDDLFEVFLNLNDSKSQQLLEKYLEAWFGVKTPISKEEKEKVYLAFYQSLFIHYKQVIPTNKT